jgi:hypothetical protein
MTFRLPSSTAAILLIGFAGAVSASPAPKAVIELFTSQGCSSCPPADALLAELADRSDVIALSLPVDYWDYLGWKDTLAQPAFTARQRAYASARNDKQVYTPQVIINGAKPIVGSDREKIETLILKSSSNGALPVPVSVNEAGGTVTVAVGPSPDGASSGEVWLLPIVKAREVAIGRGENKGRTITYANVVRGFVKIGDWSGAAGQFEFPAERARASEAESFVVLLQTQEDGKPGAILGAGRPPRF